MKIFEQPQVHEAEQHALDGHQALHLFDGRIADAVPGAPRCFRNRREVGHLFDQDRERLVKTARRLGVRVIFVDRDGMPHQHIDLCGRPLERAKQEGGLI